MLRVYKCEKCGKTLISKEEINLVGWKEIKAGEIEGAVEKHLPVVRKEGGQVSVDVGSVAHPMTAEHLIEWVAIETNKGYQVQYWSADSAPKCIFALAEGEELVKAYAYCNLHGLWAAE